MRFQKDIEKDRENQNKFLYFDFDVLMTNPLFAGTVKERDILKLYKLAEKNGKWVNKIGRHILFWSVFTIYKTRWKNGNCFTLRSVE